MVLAGMPGPLSSTTIDPPSTVTETAGAISASSQASIALSTSSLSATFAYSYTSWPVWLTSSRRVQNSATRDTVKGTRVSLRFPCAAVVFSLLDLPRFVKTWLFKEADLACRTCCAGRSMPTTPVRRRPALRADCVCSIAMASSERVAGKPSRLADKCRRRPNPWAAFCVSDGRL
jgi:hypothetical protein